MLNKYLTLTSLSKIYLKKMIYFDFKYLCFYKNYLKIFLKSNFILFENESRKRRREKYYCRR